MYRLFNAFINWLIKPILYFFSRFAQSVIFFIFYISTPSFVLAQAFDLRNLNMLPPDKDGGLDLNISGENCSGSASDTVSTSDEIVVCAKVQDTNRYRLQNREEAQDAFAKETMDKGAPRAPNFARPECVPSLLSLCLRASVPEPKPTLLDLRTLPQAPEGSDADNISKGLVRQP